MFNFWPFNVARKRREREEAERLAQQFRKDHDDITAFWAQPKRNKVIPMDDPRHPRNLTPEQRQRIKERQAEHRAVLQKHWDAQVTAQREATERLERAFKNRRTETSAPPADDWNSNLLNPMNFASPLNPIYHSSPAPESRCDSPTDSSSYDSGSSSCSTD